MAVAAGAGPLGDELLHGGVGLGRLVDVVVLVGPGRRGRGSRSRTPARTMRARASAR